MDKKKTNKVNTKALSKSIKQVQAKKNSITTPSTTRTTSSSPTDVSSNAKSISLSKTPITALPSHTDASPSSPAASIGENANSSAAGNAIASPATSPSAGIAVLKKRADGTFSRPLRELLMIQISRVLDERGWTQKQAAEFLGVTQPRISDLSRVLVDNFTIDLLVDWLGALGRQVTIEAKNSTSIMQQLSRRFVANEDAVPYYTKAITVDPLRAENYLKRGDAYYVQGKYDLAVGDFTRAMELAPNHPEIRLRRADSYVKLGQDRAAIFDCDKVLAQIASAEDWPDTFFSVIQSDDTASEQALIEITWWAYLCKGRALQALDEDNDALVAFSNSINAAPHFGQSYYDRGRLFEKLEQFDKALIDYEQATVCDPSDVPSSDKLAELRRKLEPATVSNDVDDEIAKFSAELEQAKSPERKAYCYRKRAETYHNRKEYTLAIADYTRAIELDPSQSWVWSYITYGRYMTGDYEGVIKDCDNVILGKGTKEDISGAHMYKGWALEKLHRNIDALESYNLGVKKNPQDTNVLWARGILLEKMENIDDALIDYRQTIELATRIPGVDSEYIDHVREYLDNLVSRVPAATSKRSDDSSMFPSIPTGAEAPDNDGRMIMMYDWLSPRGRRAIMHAEDEARRLGHKILGTEFILLGLILEGTGASALALAKFGFGLESTRMRVEDIIGQGPYLNPKSIRILQMPVTNRTKQLFEFALSISHRMHVKNLTADHLLIGLIDQTLESQNFERAGIDPQGSEIYGVAAQILINSGADLQELRNTVLKNVVLE